MSDLAQTDATWQQWFSDPAGSFTAVAEHAINVDQWGGMPWWGWLVAGISVLIPIAKRLLPGPVTTLADLAWSFIAPKQSREQDAKKERLATVGSTVLTAINDLPQLRKLIGDHIDDGDLDIIEEELAKLRRENRELKAAADG